MQILFDNNEQVQIELSDNPLAEPIVGYFKKIFRHLQHIDIPFKPWNNPYYDRTNAVESLSTIATALNIDLDKSQCRHQQYLNYLHQLLEERNDGSPQWLDFDSLIHICEGLENPRTQVLKLSYGEKAAHFLEQDFRRQFLDGATTRVKPGDVYIRCSEYGKTPYHYWKDKEPDDLSRLTHSAHPWLKIRPGLLVALEEHEFLENEDYVGFNQWWRDKEDHWCKHWGLESWNIQDMLSVVVFGRVSDDGMENISTFLQNQIHPQRVIL